MTPELKGYLLLSVLKMVVVFTIIMIGVALVSDDVELDITVAFEKD